MTEYEELVLSNEMWRGIFFLSNHTCAKNLSSQERSISFNEKKMSLSMTTVNRTQIIHSPRSQITSEKLLKIILPVLSHLVIFKIIIILYVLY